MKHILTFRSIFPLISFTFVSICTLSETKIAFRHTEGKMSPKVWFSYVQKFIQSKLCQLIDSTLMDFKVKLLSKSKLFCKTSRINFYRPNRPPQKVTLFCVKSTDRFMVVKGATGHIKEIPPQSQDIVKVKNAQMGCQFIFANDFTWKICLNHKFSLNYSVDYLFLDSFPVLCNKTKFAVQSNEEMYIFCHTHSRFSLFPPFGSIFIKLITKTHSIFILNSTFMVLDKNLIQTLQVEHNRINCTKPYSSILIVNTSVEHMYLVQVEKIHTIVFKKVLSDRCSVVVYDGPDTDSQSFVACETNCRSSTFQSLIQLDVKYFNFSFWIPPLTYCSHQRNFTEQTVLLDHEPVLYFLPNYKCTSAVCFLHFESQENKQVNISVLKFEYIGKEHKSCQFGGLFGAEVFNNTYFEHTLLCESDTKRYVQMRRYYSQNSSLSLYLFWYGHLSAINSEVIITQTACRPVFICPCISSVLHLFDFNYEEFAKHRSKIEVSNYLASVTKMSNVDFRISDLLHGDFPPFSLSSNACTTIQLIQSNALAEQKAPFNNHSVVRHWLLPNRDVLCSFYLGLNIFSPGYQISFEAKMSVRASSALPLYNKYLRSKYRSFASVWFRLIPQGQYVIRQKFPMNNVHFTRRLNSPIIHSDLHFKLNWNPNSKSWLEVVLQMKRVKRKMYSTFLGTLHSIKVPIFKAIRCVEKQYSVNRGCWVGSSRFLGDLRSLVRFVSFWKKRAKSEQVKSNYL